MCIRVGRIKYVNGEQVYPSFKGFSPIVVMTKSSEYGAIGPYELKDENGYIFEDLWQFSKVYEKVPETHEVYTQRYRVPAWDHPAEIHMKDGFFTQEFWSWRQKGLSNAIAVRYPVGRKNMHLCKFAIPYDTPCNHDSLVSIDSIEHLDYIQSRKRTYIPVYIELASKQELFKQLKQRHEDGEDLLIIEVDGPHQESLSYYMQKYGVGKDFIEKDTIIASEDNMKIIVNDPKHPAGHGYALAIGLQDFDYSNW